MRLRNHRGYTLVEVMVTVAILGVIASIGPQLLTNLFRTVRLNSAKIEIQRDARICLDLINRDLRQALASTVVIDQVAGQPPGSRITFDTMQASTSTAESVQYYQTGRKLYMNGRQLSENLRYIAFTYPRTDDDQIISIAVTFEKGTYGGQTKALQMAVEKVRIMND